MRSYRHWQRFNVHERLIFESRYWLVVTRPHQITLGSCNILLKREAKSVPEVNLSEFVDLKFVIGKFERLLVGAFSPTRFNYVLSGQKDPFVHVHAIPRYDPSSAQRFAERDWYDTHWPYFPEFPRTLLPTDEWLVDEVTRHLQKGMIRWFRR